MNAPISAILDRKGCHVYSVPPTATIADAVAEMNRNRVGSILVMEGRRLVGIFTERDVLRRVVSAALNPKCTGVVEVMSRNVITISRDATVEETTRIFTEKRCRHLPVVEDGEVCGPSRFGDITRWIGEVYRAEAEHLKNYITSGFSA